MAEVPFFFVGFALLLGALAMIAVWSHRDWRAKLAACALLAAALPLGYFGHVELLSKPKPLALEIRDLGQTEVIAAVLEEGTAIHLWLEIAGRPRYYDIPWNQVAALNLQAAMREAGRTGVGVGARLQELQLNEFEATQERRAAQLFYPLPVPAPPEKQRTIVRSPRFDY
jgi:hypothetical protein